MKMGTMAYACRSLHSESLVRDDLLGIHSS